MRVLGIDPGLLGGAAILEAEPASRPKLLVAIDLPTHGEAAKRRIDAGAFSRWIKKYAPDIAFIERAQAMPDQGSSSGFIYGRAVGALEACVMCCDVPLFIVESRSWKNIAGLPGGKANKEAARQRAIMLWPGSDLFALMKHHQRAEAALIALYSLDLQRQKVAA